MQHYRKVVLNNQIDPQLIKTAIIGQKMTIELNKCYRTSENVVAREIEGELVIVPLKSGLGNLDAEMYALSTTGISVWEKLDGNHPLDSVIEALSMEYNTSYNEILTDVVSLMGNLLEKGLVVES